MENTSKNHHLEPLNLTPAQEQNPRFIDTLIIGTWLIGKSEKTKKTYQKVIRQFFLFHPKISIQTTTTAHISVFLKDMENRGVSPTTLNLYMNALGSLFKSALKQRRIEVDPSHPLKNYKVQDTVYQRILELDQIKQMILKEKRPRNVLLIKVLFYLGLRVSEVVEIHLSDFVVKKDGVILNVKGKGSKIRQAPLSDDLWREIQVYAQDWGLRPSDNLFFDEKNKGKKISTVSIWKAVRASAKRAKVEPLPSPHWFRHTSATLSLEGGAPIHVVQARLGHASLSTTSRYLHAKASEGLSKYLPNLDTESK
ncbi:MAG: tyrosine-type recombinase/integrase [Pseudobdellovibrionaceae bacterium]